MRNVEIAQTFYREKKEELQSRFLAFRSVEAARRIAQRGHQQSEVLKDGLNLEDINIKQGTILRLSFRYSDEPLKDSHCEWIVLGNRSKTLFIGNEGHVLPSDLFWIRRWRMTSGLLDFNLNEFLGNMPPRALRLLPFEDEELISDYEIRKITAAAFLAKMPDPNNDRYPLKLEEVRFEKYAMQRIPREEVVLAPAALALNWQI